MQIERNYPQDVPLQNSLKYYACIEREILRKKDFEEKWRSLFPFSFLGQPLSGLDETKIKQKY